MWSRSLQLVNQDSKWLLKYAPQTTFYGRNSFSSCWHFFINAENNHSNDCANIEMGGNWRKILFNTKVEIVKNKLTSIRSLKFKKIHEAGTKERQIYYTKEVSRILWLELRMNLYFADNCKVSFVSSKYVPTIWSSAANQRSQTTDVTFGTPI